MTPGGIVLLVGGILLALEGILKFLKPDFKLLRMGLPCGGALLITGVGLVLFVLGV
jgi:uncharacterized membrane protein YidH (DUF202 family)